MKHICSSIFILFLYLNVYCQDNIQSISPAKADSIDKANTKMIRLSGKNIHKATVSKKDSSIYLIANMRQDHRIFGYQKPDINSKKELLISIFTSDVEGNPFKCPLGAYYQTNTIYNIELKFISIAGSFIKVKAIKEDGTSEMIYILKQWLEFEN